MVFVREDSLSLKAFIRTGTDYRSMNGTMNDRYSFSFSSSCAFCMVVSRKSKISKASDMK